MMKWLLIFATIFGMTTNVAATDANRMKLNDLIKNIPNEWKILEVKPNESSELWFFRKNLGAKTIRADESLKTLIYFTIKFEPVRKTGLPNESDTIILYDFEKNIIPKVEKDAGCIHVASVVKGGIKDHLFYVSDPDLFLKTISFYQEHLKGFGISIEKHYDPNWEIYDDFPESA